MPPLNPVTKSYKANFPARNNGGIQRAAPYLPEDPTAGQQPEYKKPEPAEPAPPPPEPEPQTTQNTYYRSDT
jgi:hypothetical protein